MNDFEKLKTSLEYNPETGAFIWLLDNGGNVKAGDVAGTENDSGYIRIDVLGKQYPAQRLAWLYMTGNWPSLQIDHVNLNKSDNKWINLREATPSQNKLNAGVRADNVSGFKGVKKSGRKWMARCTRNGERIYLGIFDTPEMASIAYQQFAKKYHGEFFRPN